MSADRAAERIFLDMNVMLYERDRADPAKQARAAEWMRKIWLAGCGAISWQVLHEFYSVAIRKAFRTKLEARRDVESLLQWRPIDTTPDLIRRAWSWMDSAQLPYWDALILAAAERSGARYLLSEDFQSGRDYDGVLALDPFGPAGAALLQRLTPRPRG